MRAGGVSNGIIVTTVTVQWCPVWQIFPGALMYMHAGHERKEGADGIQHLAKRLSFR